MGHTCKNRSLFEKLVTPGTMSHTQKNGLYLKKGNTWKNGSHLENWVKKKLVKHGKKVTVGRKVHTQKNKSELKKWVTNGKNGSHLEKSGTLRNIGQTWKQRLQLEKMSHNWNNWSHLETGSHLKNVSNFEKWVPF